MLFIHYKHALPSGILIIDSVLATSRDVKVEQVDMPDGPDISNQQVNDPGIRLKFECGLTGARFDAEYTHSQLCAICPLFTMDDELSDTLSEIPVVLPQSDDTVTIRFIVAGKKKTYNVDLKLAPGKYMLSRDEIMKLCAENAILRKSLAERKVKESAELKAGNERLDRLEEELFKYDTDFAIAIQKCEKIKSDQAQVASDLSLAEAKLRDKTNVLSVVETKLHDTIVRLRDVEYKLTNTSKQLATLETRAAEARSTLRTVESAHAELTGAVGFCKALFGNPK